jgi:hypothetical protein
MNMSKLKTAPKLLLVVSLITSSTMAFGAQTMQQKDAAKSIADICNGKINTAEDVQVAYQNCDETTLNKMFIALDKIKKDADELNSQLAELERNHSGDLEKLATLKTNSLFAMTAFYGGVVGAVALSPGGNLIPSMRGVGVALLVAAMAFAYNNKNNSEIKEIELKIDYKHIKDLKTQLTQMHEVAMKKAELIAWMVQLRSQQSK